MRRILLSTVSRPVLNLSTALHEQRKAKETDEYREFAEEQASLRYKQIFNGRPYQGMF
jgi:hypothetical protein